MLGHLRAPPFPGLSRDLAKLIGFARLYDCISLVASWRYWVPDVDFECRMQAYDEGVLVGCHNVELFANTSTIRGGLHDSRLEWWEGVERCRGLSVPTPPIREH